MNTIAQIFRNTTLFFLSGFCLAANPTKPNILLVMAEDISTDLACYGMKAVKTPVLDKMTKEGIRFTNCFGNNSICSPSRSTIMTGVYQTMVNTYDHRSNSNVPLDEKIKPITYLLREAGYTCILGNSAVQINGRKTDCNFKHTPLGEWDGKTQFGLFDKFDEFTPTDQPFFAQVQLQVTHRGDWWDEVRKNSAQPVNPADVELPPFIANTPGIRLDWAKYLDQIESADYEMGLILNQLKEKGLYDNTIVIFMGDNGRCNIRGKGYLYDSGLRIPLIAWFPSKLKPGVDNGLVDLTDISATVLQLAGVKIPDYASGYPFLNVENRVEKPFIYSTRDRWDEIRDCSRAISTKKYKYIRHYLPEVPYDAHQEYLEFHRPPVHLMRKLYAEGKLTPEQKLFFDPKKPWEEELYDLEADPHELKNLAYEKQYKSVLDSMRTMMASWQKQHTDRGLELLEENKKVLVQKPDGNKLTKSAWVKKYKPEWWSLLENGEHVNYKMISAAYDEFYKLGNKK